QLVTIKLNDSNYLMWKHQVLATTRGYGLEGFILGTSIPPEKFTTDENGNQSINPLYISWQKQDQLLVSWVLSSLTEEILINTIGLNTSSEIWYSLELDFTTHLEEALTSPQWKKAMDTEYNALLHNNTWTLTELPPGKKAIGCRWVFKLKKHSDGTVAKHKARLVAKGFSQIPGMDFTETFSHVVKPITIRTVLSIAISKCWFTRQIDVDNAFLNGDLDTTIYMVQPPGYEHNDNSVCLLKKSLYGLRQASRSWYLKLGGILCSLGFKTSKSDTSLFLKIEKAFSIFILAYVDDMIIVGSDNTQIDHIITALRNHFALKDLGPLNYFLGLEVEHTAQGLFLNQSSYIKSILKKAGMTNCKPLSTPMVSTPCLSKHQGQPIENGTLYRQLIGALQYATITRPEITFTVNKCSQYMQNPLDTHWKALKRLLRYLSGTLHLGLHISKSPSLQLMAYADSDWATDIDDR
ncbi:cysteine-rich RLK (RECEPTOR-like protein kinase) 8, partial [Striga hermonthica]